MTTAYTSLLGLALPVTGELSGTWGDVVNQSITSLVDTAVAGTTNVSADSNVTLTTTTGASNQARQAILLFSGARTAIRTVTAPAQSKIYTVINATTGGFAVTLVGAGPTTGVTIANGARTVVAWNGSDFVEVSSPSSIILPGGTANGVLYLNGSKVVTSGSALTFDGTNFATTGNIRSSGANGNIGATGTTGNATLALQTNARLWTMGTSNSDSALYWRDETASAEQMRLTSTGLGIGTSSPTRPVSIGGAGSRNYFLAETTTNSVSYEAGLQVKTPSANFLFGSWGNTNALWIYDVNATTERLRLDSSGNLGLGVTPSAWGGSYIGLQVKNAMSLWTTNGASAYYSNNVYYDGTSRKYVFTGTAAEYEQGAGIHSWKTAASGTAGNAITFTQAMTLDASGQLLVGATSSDGVGSNRLQLGSSGANAQLLLKTSGAHAALYVTGADVYQTWASGGFLALGHAPANGSTFTEYARITSGGNFAINGGYFLTSSTAQSMGLFGGPTVSNNCARFEANGSTYPSTANHAFVRGEPIVFSNITAVEYARITSGGNLLVGNTSSSFNERIVSYSSSSYTYGSYRTGTGSEGHIIFCNGNGAVGSIFTNGTTTSFNTSSDYRLKNITGNLTGYKERLMSLQPKQGTWKVDGSEFRGFLAHEFANPYSASVSGEKDAVDAEGKPIMQSMQASSSEVMADLVALVQEQQAIIESLKARLDAANL